MKNGTEAQPHRLEKTQEARKLSRGRWAVLLRNLAEKGGPSKDRDLKAMQNH